MPVPFAALDALLSGAVNETFGEVFRFEAFKQVGDVDLPMVADETRAMFEAVAIWADPAVSKAPHARGALQDDNAHNWTAGHSTVLIDDDKLLWRPRSGDVVTRIEDGSVYRISKPPRPDGMGHTTIPLTDRKR